MVNTGAFPGSCVLFKKHKNMIIFICVFYYLFSVFFMAGYILNTDESNPWVILVGIVLVLIFAPFLLPFTLGLFVSKK